MTRLHKLFAYLWFLQSAYFLFGLYAMGRTFGGVGYLVHVGAGWGASGVVFCAILAALTGVALHRNRFRLSLPLLVGGVCVYVVVGVFSGEAVFQLLMPPFMEAPVIRPYLVGTGLSLVTSLVHGVTGFVGAESGSHA